MKRGDLVAFAAIALLTLFAAGVFWTIPAHADSRLYPYAELSYRFESTKEPRPWAALGCPLSLGKFAPSISGGVAPPVHGEPLALRGDIAVRFKF